MASGTPAGGVAGRHRDRRRAGDVEHQPALLVVGFRDRRRIVDPARQQQARQRDHRVEIVHRVGELPAQRAAQLLCPDVFRRRDEGARQQTVAGQRREILRPLLHILLVDCVGLGLMDGAVAVGPQRQRRQPDGFDAGAELLQRGDGLLDGAHLVGIGFGVLFVEMLDDADAQSLQPGLQIRQAVRRRALRRGRVVRIVAGDGVKQNRVVLDACASSARRGRANRSAGTRRSGSPRRRSASSR